jgi:hypothetical protein
VTAEFVDEMAALGHPLEEADDAIAFRIHGITPEFVREMRDLGFEDLDSDELLKIKIHRFDELLRKRRVRR